MTPGTAAGNERLQVLVVDDDGLTRSGIAAGLTQQGLRVVAQAEDAATALALWQALRPDAVVLDLDLGIGPTGLDVAQAVAAQRPGAGIVMLTAYADPRLAGAAGDRLPPHAEYLVKQEVANVAAVAVAVRRSVARANGNAVLEPTRPDGVPLTEVQIDVLRMVAAGLTNGQIAKARGVSEKSVEHVITRLCASLGVESERNARVALAREFQRMSGAGRGRNP